MTSDSNSFRDGAFCSYPQGWALFVSDISTRHNSAGNGKIVFQRKPFRKGEMW